MMVMRLEGLFLKKLLTYGENKYDDVVNDDEMGVCFE